MRSSNWFIFGLAAQFRRLRSDSRGVVAIVVGLAIPVLLGFAALAVDTSVWSSAKNSAQGAADAAALSAMAAATAGSSATQINNEAYASSALSGFSNGQNGVTVTINHPPKSGPNTSNNSAYEVIITQPQKTFYGAMLGSAPTVTGRAVALLQGPACILALDPSASSSIGMSGGATVADNKCNVADNSSSPTAVTLSGGSTLKAPTLNDVGNYSVTGGSTMSVTTINTGAAATPDPYKNLAVPSLSSCAPVTPPLRVRLESSSIIAKLS
ncbi:MAG: TadE/TadG family type IV pilus assembly protein [Stellaceae bacterium]